MKLRILGCWAGAVGMVASCANRVELGSDPQGATGGQAGSPVDIGVGGGSGGGPNTIGGTGGVGGKTFGDGGAPVVEIGGSGGSGGFGGLINTGVGGLPGSLNTPCVPGRLAIEAQGTVAEAEVRTLDRCTDGLSCNNVKICVPTPACPAATGGDCLVYVGSAAGGASGGAGNTGGQAYGTGGQGVGSVLPSGVTIAGIAADDSKLYFIDYGTRDALGNYKNDGALKAYSFQSATTSTLTTQLTGPVALGITTSHAYVALDGAPLSNNPPHKSVVRVSLSGGAPELVRDNAGFSGEDWAFKSAGSTAFWSEENATYTMTESGSPPTLLFPKSEGLAATDGQYLYHTGCEVCTGLDHAIWRSPIAGGTAQKVVSPVLSFGVKQSFLYGAETIDNVGLILDRVPASGGTWQRVRALGAGGGYSFRMAGDRYFLNQPETLGSVSVLTAVLDSTEPPIRVLERRPQHTLVERLWVGTSKVLYWSDGRSIYSRTFDPLP